MKERSQWGEHRWGHRTEAKESMCDVTMVTAGSADSETLPKAWTVLQTIWH